MSDTQDLDTPACSAESVALPHCAFRNARRLAESTLAVIPLSRPRLEHGGHIIGRGCA